MKENLMEQSGSPPRLPKFLERYDTDEDGQLSESEINRILQSAEPERARIEEETAFLVVLEILAAAKIARSKLVPTEGISFDEFSILAVLQADSENNKLSSSYQGLPQSNISLETNLPPSTVSLLLDRLAKRKGKDELDSPWITRVENPLNRREKLIGITPEGKSNLRKARKDYKTQIRTSLLSALDLHQLLDIRDILFRFNVSLNPKHDPSGGQSQEAEASELQTPS